jgi:hypothetical protein
MKRSSRANRRQRAHRGPRKTGPRNVTHEEEINPAPDPGRTLPPGALQTCGSVSAWLEAQTEEAEDLV